MATSRCSVGRRLSSLIVVVLALVSLPVTAGSAWAATLFDDVPLAGWRVNGETKAVLVTGDTTYVGGSFTEAIAPDGTRRARANLAAFDTRTGAILEGFSADTNGWVHDLVSDGATLFVGGSFSSIGGAQRYRLAAVDAVSGAVRSFRSNASSHVYSLDLRAGRLFVGGSFGTLGGVSRSRVAAVDPATGAVDDRWNPSADDTVQTVRSDATGEVVYVGGNFTTIGGASRQGVAAVSGTTGAALSPVFSNSYPILDLDLDDSGSRLFGAVAGWGNQVAAWDTTTGERVWRQYADGDVQAVAHHRGTVYFGFHEGFAGDTSLRLLAADAGTGALDPGFRPTWNRWWGVHALAVSDDVLAAAGDFTYVSGVAVEGLALFPANGGSAEPPPPTETETFISASSRWRYFDLGREPGSGWRGAGFDDSAWASGLPQLGYGDGDETTVVSYGPDANDKYITTYFRTTFDAPAAVSSATLSLLADDGAVVYVNGVEAVRDNMPAGTITYDTLAASNRSGSAENAFRTFQVDPTLLRVGTNHVAVEVHQDYRGSSDIGFDLRFEGQVDDSSSPATDLAIRSVSAPAEAVAGETVTVAVEVANEGDTELTDVPLEYAVEGGSLGRSGDRVTMSPGATVRFSVDWTVPSSAGSYRFTASHDLADDDSSDDSGAVDVMVADVASPVTDLAIRSVSAPVEAVAGETVTVAVEVANEGDTEITDVPVGYDVGGGSLGRSGDRVTLSPGATARFTVDWTVPSSAGSYRFTASHDLADDDNSDDSGAVDVTVEAVPEPLGAVHVSDLDASTVTGPGPHVDVRLTIAVSDANGAPVGGASVTGTWSDGTTATCTTASGTGRCDVVGRFNSKHWRTVTFTVTACEATGFRYEPAANTDPDGDSDGTSITVSLAR